MDTYRYGIRVVGHVFHNGTRTILPGFTDLTAASRELDLAALSPGEFEATVETVRHGSDGEAEFISPEEARLLDEIIDADYQQFCTA